MHFEYNLSLLAQINVILFLSKLQHSCRNKTIGKVCGTICSFRGKARTVFFVWPAHSPWLFLAEGLHFNEWIVFAQEEHINGCCQGMLQMKYSNAK